MSTEFFSLHRDEDGESFLGGEIPLPPLVPSHRPRSQSTPHALFTISLRVSPTGTRARGKTPIEKKPKPPSALAAKHPAVPSRLSFPFPPDAFSLPAHKTKRAPHRAHLTPPGSGSGSSYSFNQTPSHSQERATGTKAPVHHKLQSSQHTKKKPKAMPPVAAKAPIVPRRRL